ncbi:MAG: LysM peptidoglycan-binding domain-containing protein [Acidobacteria bacterium]|jgi:LysM repeat protein|nr:LysM peptidoglycan-binding domain-containing protein [Acidobacteriota bacterium]
MKSSFNFKFLVAILAVFFVFGSIDSFAQTRRPTIRQRSRVTRPTADLYTVRSGETLRVRMNETLNSRTARVGDRFTTTVTEPVYSNNGVIVIPTGSTVVGRVDSVKPAKKGGDPGQIDVSFIEVKLPNGTRRAINGSLTNLSSDDAKSDAEGTVSGDDRKNDKIIFIGGGAGGGAILGGLIGGGKGAIIGGILGGLGGLAGERLTKGEDAKVESGTQFGVILNQSVLLPKFGEVNTRNDNTYEPRTNSGQTYTVRPGDTLAKISQRFYGTTRRYLDIYEANRDVLRSPSQIEVGQELRIP